MDGGQSESPSRHLGGEERLEHASPCLVAHAGARVADLETDVVTVRGLPQPGGVLEVRPCEVPDPGADRNGARAVADGLDGIRDEAHQHQTHLSGVGFDRRNVRGQILLDSHVRWQRGAHEPQQLVHQC